MGHADTSAAIAPVAKRLTNELPKPFRSWLDFVDDLPEEVRAVPVVKVEAAVPEDVYYELFREHPRNGTLVEWVIYRDFYLARAAEELLPARISVSDYHAAKMAAASGPFDTRAIDAVLEQVAKVARAQ